MGIWDNEKRYREGELVRVGQALERVALKRGLSGRDFQPGPREFTTVIDVAPLARAQQDTAHGVDGLWSAALGNGVILKRIEGIGEKSYEVQREALDVLYGTKSVLQHGFTFLGVCLGGIADELGEVNRNLVQANGLLRLQVDETRLQGELARAQMASMAASQIREGWERTRLQEESAERRHQEQMSVLQTPAATRANEKYGHAVTQYDTGNPGACVDDLDATLNEQSTHAPSHILLGICAYEAGQPAMAKAAFRKAAKYALHDKLFELYVDAMLRLARLERLVGNHDQGLEVIREASRAVEPGSDLHTKLVYESVRARFVRPDRTESLGAIAHALRQVFEMDTNLRDEVAASPFWKEVVDADPYLRYGNAPFIRLAEMMKPRTDPDVYTMTLHICEVGKKPLPDEVREHLERLQEKRLYPHRVVFQDGDEFGRGHEQTLLFLFRELRARGETEEATRVLYAEDTMMELWMSLVEFERFKLEIAGQPVDDALVVRIKTDLRRILRARPELRDEVEPICLFGDDLFAASRKACPWLSSGNSPFAEVDEAMGVLLSHHERSWWTPVDVGRDFRRLVEAVTLIIRKTNWGRMGVVERDRLLMEKVQPLFVRLADAWQPSSFEGVSRLVQSEAEQVLFLSLMASPCMEVSQLPEFEEHLERVYGVLRDPVRREGRLAREHRVLGDTRMTVATSPLFAEYRQVRAEEDARLLRLKREAKAEAERLRQEQARKALEEAEVGWREASLRLSSLNSRLQSSGGRYAHPGPSILSRFYVGYRLVGKYGDSIYSLMRGPDQSLSGETWVSWCRGRTQDINNLLRDVRQTEGEMNRALSSIKWNLPIVLGILSVNLFLPVLLLLHASGLAKALPFLLSPVLGKLSWVSLTLGVLMLVPLSEFLPDLIRDIKKLRR